jgi:DNA-binding winged helix-turn-helix (wHTH) protein
LEEWLDKVIYVCGDVRVDPGNRRLTRNGDELALEPKAFAVLLVLLARAGELVTRDELLDAVWGHRYITPATLNRVMVLLRRAFDDDPERPRFIETVHGAGYRFVAPVERVATTRREVRAHFGPPPIAHLPAKLEPLIGRDRELGQLTAMISEHRSVTVIGPGGMGKTQCALEVGRQCEGDFPDGVWFFDLSPLERAQDWVRVLAATLSVPTAGTQTLLPRLAGALTGR